MGYPIDFSPPEKVVAAVKSNDRITLANLCSEPRIFPKLLMDRANELRNVRLFHLRPCGDFAQRYLIPGEACEMFVAHPRISSNPQSPTLPTVSRFHADYVVTEQGTASLRDKTARELASAVLELAHPDFVDELLKDGRTLKLFN